MPDRSVLQWDKDDCAAIDLVKFDLLGLGMLSALHRATDYIAEFRGKHIDLAEIPQEDEVYAMLCRADSVGVFQVESRAQMSTLPRLKPRRFYDLVVEVALSSTDPSRVVSAPAIRRRNGLGARHVPAPVTGEQSRQNARRAVVPGATHANGDRRRGFHSHAGR